MTSPYEKCYTPGTHLVDVPPDFRGPIFHWDSWVLFDLKRQTDERHRKWIAAGSPSPGQGWVNDKSIATKRDHYGR